LPNIVFGFTGNASGNTYVNNVYTEVYGFTISIPNGLKSAYYAISWTFVEDIGISPYVQSYSAVYIDFLTASTSQIFTPLTINSTNGGYIGEYVTNDSIIFQSFSVNDFVNLGAGGGYDGTPITCRVWQIGVLGGPSSIDIRNSNFSIQFTELKPTGPNQTPTFITATAGSYPP
jgi:hypothetical protein